MNREDRQSLIALPIAILAAIGIAWAGSQGGYTVKGIPIFALGVGLAFIVQWLAFIPACLKQTQKFYDLTGSITNLMVIAISMLLTPVRDVRSWLLAFIIMFWAARLGYFLFTRILADGEDRRFVEIKTSFIRFLLAWTMQGLWVALTLAAALAAITSMLEVPMDLYAVAGSLVCLSGLLIEITADRQKRKFRADPANRDRFIRTGLWAWSRHPNYFGEITLWIGVALIALPVLRGWQYATLISPVFVTILLTRISGIPMLEKRANEKWGGQPEYEAYKRRTPVLIPRPPVS